MDKTPIKKAMVDALSAHTELYMALNLEYSISLKSHVSEAIYRLKSAVETLERMERGG